MTVMKIEIYDCDKNSLHWESFITMIKKNFSTERILLQCITEMKHFHWGEKISRCDEILLL